jgi:hypothetical protein
MRRHDVYFSKCVYISHFGTGVYTRNCFRKENAAHACRAPDSGVSIQIFGVRPSRGHPDGASASSHPR